MSVPDEILTRLHAARTRLILERPFVGALVMSLPLVAASGRTCRTVATDARALYFNPEYIAGLSFAETQFVLAHEALHCALGHFARRSHRTPHRWDVATDYAVNLLLVDEGLKPPRGALVNPEWRGLAAEEIYPLIPPDTPEKPLDRHVFSETGSAVTKQTEDGRGVWGDNSVATAATDGVPTSADDGWDDAGNETRTSPGAGLRPPNPAEQEELAKEWRSRLAAAAQQARHAGRVGESWLRAIDGLIQPQLPWRTLLARYMLSIARDDYSFRRPSRREGSALLPRLHSGEVDVVVALDTSGSISDPELAQFMSEVDALKGQIRARVTLHACDEALAADGPWEFQPWEPVTLPQTIGGGGGTSFTPVFDWIARERRRPDLLMYFTDAKGDFPPVAPDYPVIWLVKGKGKVPWGERIQLN